MFRRADLGFHEASGEAKHRFCARHISENVKKHYGKVCSELFEGCAYTKNCARFDRAMELIKGENAEAWEYEMGREGRKKHSYRCSRCGGQGHTKRTCRVPYEQAEGSRRRHSTSGPPSNAHMLNEFLPGKS